MLYPTNIPLLLASLLAHARLNTAQALSKAFLLMAIACWTLWMTPV